MMVIDRLRVRVVRFDKYALRSLSRVAIIIKVVVVVVVVVVVAVVVVMAMVVMAMVVVGMVVTVVVMVVVVMVLVWGEGSGWMAVVVVVMAESPLTPAGVTPRSSRGDLACRRATTSLLADTMGQDCGDPWTM